MAGIVERTREIIEVAKANVGLELRLAAAGTGGIAAKGELILLAKKAETGPISKSTVETAINIATKEIQRKTV